MSPAKKVTNNTINIAELVDRLGRTKASIADLEKKEEADVKILKNRGVGEYTGTLFNANVFTQERGNTINWEAIAKELKANRVAINRYTQTRTVTTTDWEALARWMEPDEALVKKHTTVGQTITVCKVTAR